MGVSEVMKFLYLDVSQLLLLPARLNLIVQDLVASFIGKGEAFIFIPQAVSSDMLILIGLVDSCCVNGEADYWYAARRSYKAGWLIE